jgi:hypothetical protein
MKSAFLRNVGKHSPSNAMSHPQNIRIIQTEEIYITKEFKICVIMKVYGGKVARIHAMKPYSGVGV